MDWQHAAAARQLLVEERIGTRIREKQAVEDATFRKSAKDVPRG